MTDIKLINYGGFFWARYDNPPYIGIDDVIAWIENISVVSIVHEIIHIAIYNLEGWDATQAFDNIFGFIDPSIMLVPESDDPNFGYDRYWRQRTENLWNRLQRSNSR